MQLQNIIRTRLLIVGFGAALLFAGAAGAQEITNTPFADGPYATPYTQADPSYRGVEAPSNSQAAETSAVISTPDNTARNAATEPPNTSERIMWIGVALVWIGAVGIYFVRLPKQVVRNLLLSSLGDARVE